jgi:hypothetical protein
VGVYQVCSNKSPGVKIVPDPGGGRVFDFSLNVYRKNLKNLLLKNPKSYSNSYA